MRNTHRPPSPLAARMTVEDAIDAVRTLVIHDTPFPQACADVCRTLDLLGRGDLLDQLVARYSPCYLRHPGRLGWLRRRPGRRW
jgi:hypothetical protein